jgi:hypothetical protein
MAIAAALSLWPFSFSRRWRSWNLYLPVAGLLLYGVFELSLPEETQPGWAMSMVMPLLLFLWINGIAKVVVLARLQDVAGGSRRRLRQQPQRRWQLAAAIPILAGCAWWGWRALGG